MPHRVFHLLLGIVGLLAVLGLYLAWRDPARHRTTGAPWKRRLLSAGLLLLGSMGFGAGCNKNKTGPAGGKTTLSETEGGKGGETTQPAEPSGDQTDQDDQANAMRREISLVTEEATAVASGKKGSYPFDEEGKKALLDGLKRAQATVDGLSDLGEINRGEADLWKADLSELVRGVQKFRPTEMQAASCYEPMPMPVPARDSLERLAKRMPALEKLTAADKLHPEVVRKVLRQVEADLKVLSDPAERGKLGSADKKQKANDTAKKVKETMDRIRNRLDGTSASKRLPDDMTVVQSALAAAEPLAQSGAKSTTAQREEIDDRLQGAYAALDRLVKANELPADEARLLRLEGERLNRAIRRFPPSDVQVRCYRRAAFNPARDSLQRLGKRLPLLEKMLARGSVTPEVLARVLPVMESDLKRLTDDAQLKRLTDTEQKQLTSTVAKARAALKRLRVKAGK